jgi:hypothetical protein
MQVFDSDHPKDAWVRESWTQWLYYKCGRLVFTGSDVGSRRLREWCRICSSWCTRDARHLNRLCMWCELQYPSGCGMWWYARLWSVVCLMLQFWFVARHLDSMEALFRTGGISLLEDNTNISQSAGNQRPVLHQSTTSTNALSVLLVLITESQWTRSTLRKIASKNVSLPLSLP